MIACFSITMRFGSGLGGLGLRIWMTLCSIWVSSLERNKGKAVDGCFAFVVLPLVALTTF